MIEELQAWAAIAESRMIDVESFKSRAIEIQNRISSAQQNFLTKVGAIRENCLLMN
jgi:hypothetical protein